MAERRKYIDPKMTSQKWVSWTPSPAPGGGVFPLVFFPIEGSLKGSEGAPSIKKKTPGLNVKPETLWVVVGQPLPRT